MENERSWALFSADFLWISRLFAQSGCVLRRCSAVFIMITKFDRTNSPELKRGENCRHFTLISVGISRGATSSRISTAITRPMKIYDMLCLTRAEFSTNARFHFAINSSPRNFKARRTIRRTLKRLLTNDETSCAKFASLAFYVGQSSDRNAAAWLDREFRDHPHDMV